MGSSPEARCASPTAPVLLFLLTAMVVGTPARAQGPDVSIAPPKSKATPDEQLLAGLERAKKDGEGLVLIAGEIRGMPCVRVDLDLVRNFNGRIQRLSIAGMQRIFGSPVNFRPRGLGAGEWLVGSITCRAHVVGSGVTVFNGPHAKFELQPGEVVDVGTLKVEYARTELMEYMFSGSGNIRLSVQPGSDARIVELKKDIPRVIAAIKRRPMVLVGASEQKVKPRGLFGR